MELIECCSYLEPFLNLDILFSLQQGLPTNSVGNSMFGTGPDMVPETDPLEFTAADMSLSTLYLHELHHRQVLEIQMPPVLTGFYPPEQCVPMEPTA